MQDTEIFSQLLKLDEEWYVQSVEVDRSSNRVDIIIAHVSQKKRSFFGRLKSNADIQSVSLRHLPLFGMRTFLHVPAYDTIDTHKIWAPAGSKLTNEMEAFLVTVLNNTESNQAAARIAGIMATESRHVVERTGAGTSKHADALSTVADTAPDISEKTNTHDVDTKSFELTVNTNIPPETHPVWQRIINKEYAVQTNAVGLKMLLERLRQDIAHNASEVTLLKSAKLLRQYFIKNQNQHKADIAIMTGVSTPAVNQDNISVLASNAPIFPAVNHDCWQKVINAELQIQTSNVALQMMVERVRQSVARNPSASSRQVGARILRQFFIKHEDRLSAEMEQMGIASMTAEHDVVTDSVVPGEDATCWRRLIDGALNIKTNAVGLQMMMERVRQSVARNNTDTNRTAWIKILRQYFLKNQYSSQREIRQLNSVSDDITTTRINDDQTAIPPETHPNWQRLINGELVIDTDIVALKMMLQSIRVSIDNNPSSASRTAGAKMLRQYFIKHKNKHKTELDQLIAA